VERTRLALTLCLVAFGACRREGRETAPPLPGAQGPRVVVEVFNASGRPGLARVGTRVLRREGIDVVALGTAPDSAGTLDTTRIVVRRGTRDAGTAIQRALGVGRVLVQPDSTRLLDASVFLGGDFAPRLEFHP
jgi:LytR cell envelope-related transcriptional attenuator